ncbi:tetratricopeptide repeat protein [Azospirillum sp. SYSU D00513]|uniref:tetratricopeptide repeat protein n=1 Tax=Azospirillum sp. SYSU D00513 TaxID=2812561 RepID=UPI001A96AAC2|nr:tetratricopeptide repeat protein [Azospirillum sp. SYSU D00513]
MASIGEALLIAFDLLEAGRLDQAEVLCGRILDADPGQPDAWRLSGLAAAKAGRMEEARRRLATAVSHAPERVDLRLNHIAALARQRTAAIRRVLALEPAHPAIWSALAEAAGQEEGPGAAVGPWRTLTRLQPGSAAACYNLGVALQESGRLSEAVAAYRAAARIDPVLADAHFNRGNALRDAGDTAAAIGAYRVALAAEPAARAAAHNLGLLLLPGDPAAAAALFRMAEALEPERTDGSLDRATALIAADRPGEAVAALDGLLARHPGLGRAHNSRALALRALAREAEAEAALTRALASDPAMSEAWTNRAQGLLDQGRPTAASIALRRGLRLCPDNLMALGVLAQLHHQSARPEEAVAVLRRAMSVSPQLPRALHSSYLFFRQSDPAADPAGMLAEHRRWARLHAPPPAMRSAARPPPIPAAVTAPAGSGGVLRIGYLSADLYTHSVASFLEPLLAAHDRRSVQVVCYAAVRRPDATTARLRALTDAWRDVLGLGDAALADLIRADRIDVLIELGGHTGDSRLGVLALAPAPVRITALGYPGTTGLEIEGRLTDSIVEPPEAGRWSSEPLIRLPHGFLCYQAPDGAPEPRLPPAERAPVFGSFNALGKVTPAVLTAWARILAAVPGAKLLLKSRALGDAALADELRARFAERGIAPERLDLVGWTAGRGAHLALYEHIDVGLDPFPYNGTTTTCEAMWMGVPVVTLAGDRHVARVGAALLTRVGLADLIAGDVEGYCRTAVELAADRDRLASLRTGLRERMRGGALGDAAGLAAAVEAACRALLPYAAGRHGQGGLPRSRA